MGLSLLLWAPTASPCGPGEQHCLLNSSKACFQPGQAWGSRQGSWAFAQLAGSPGLQRDVWPGWDAALY